VSYSSLSNEDEMAWFYGAWLRWLKKDNEAADKTVEAYGRALKRIVRFAGLSPGNFRPQDLSQAVLTGAMREMLAQREIDRSGTEKSAISESLYKQTLAGLQSFFDFCVLKDHLQEAPDIRRLRMVTKPDLRVNRIRNTQVGAECYSENELDHLFSTVIHSEEREDGPWPTRDWAMLCFFFDLGLSGDELRNANLNWLRQERLLDVDEDWSRRDDEFGNWMLHVPKKSGKIRHLKVSLDLLSVTEDWHGVRRERLGLPAPDEPLFVTHQGTRFTNHTLRSWLDMLNCAAGLRPRTPKAFRQTVRDRLKDQGVPASEISRFLGTQRPRRF
jgi:integrase